MISEIIPGAYDFTGKKIASPTGKRIRVFHPTFPMGRFLSQPLSEHFDDIEGLRKFLLSCSYVSDEAQFGKMDYWLPPEEFEKGKKGDCEDFALYAWRQLIDMGIKSRFVVGESGKYGSGHAWVAMEKDGKSFLFEPLACAFLKMPRLSGVRYKPEISVEYENGKISYYAHQKLNFNPSLFEAITLCCEWFVFWCYKWSYALFFIITLPFRVLWGELLHHDSMKKDGR
jgi:Transglutaminase-like domain